MIQQSETHYYQASLYYSGIPQASCHQKALVGSILRRESSRVVLRGNTRQSVIPSPCFLDKGCSLHKAECTREFRDAYALHDGHWILEVKYGAIGGCCMMVSISSIFNSPLLQVSHPKQKGKSSASFVLEPHHLPMELNNGLFLSAYERLYLRYVPTVYAYILSLLLPSMTITERRDD